MSLLHRLDGRSRRTFFWLVCILIRLLLATSFTLFTLYGAPWVAYAVGAIGIAGGLGFWYRRWSDNEDYIWWYRPLHGAIWVSAGVGAIVARSRAGADTAAIVVGSFFSLDPLVGVLTVFSASNDPWSFVKDPSSSGSDKSGATCLGNMNHFLKPWSFVKNCRFSVRDRFVNFNDAKVWGNTDDPAAYLTPWSFVHLGLSAIAGVAAFFLDKEAFGGEALWAGCLVGSFGILGWEAFENTHLDFKGRWVGNDKIDSDANLAADVAVGFLGLWGTAFLLRAMCA
tara:strand:+ start:1917 stop:2765 length:849 start_codon:yes stop_codon:yes gene_type:complete